jgi:L-asparaginase/Glu-tRNA(Gln) amidotransferase subunit D
MGNGYQSQDVMDTLMSASAQGIVVVRCSRSENMIVTRDPKLDDQYHFIAGDNLSPQKASILLSLALSATNDFETIQQIFNKY